MTEQTTQYEQVPQPQYMPDVLTEQVTPVDQVAEVALASYPAEPVGQQSVAQQPTSTNTQDVFNSVDKTDRISGTRTLYDASAGEIFWRNFLSGFARGFGMILVYVIFIVVVSLLVARFILPTVQPFISQYSDLMKSFSTMQQSTGSINEQLNSIKLPGVVGTGVQPTQNQNDQQNQVNQLYKLQNELMNGQPTQTAK